MYRGDGTVDGALGRISQRLSEIEQERAATARQLSDRPSQAAPAPTAPPAPSSKPVLSADEVSGDEWEDL
jgi:hypothetical protein